MRRIIYNEDGQGVHDSNPGSAKQDLEAWVDKVFKHFPVDTYAWCVASPDVCTFNTKAGEVVGSRFEESPDIGTTVVRELIDQGTDVLEVITDRAHTHGAEVVASMRMNDTHGMYLDPNKPGIPMFAIEHPQWVIKRLDGIPERALDYSHPEVREHRFAILRELAEDYSIEGLELDFTRWGKYFPRNEAPFKAGIMNDFVARVRRMLDEAAKKRGIDRLILGVMVPESLDLNLACGLDPKTWIGQGLLDYIVQCDYNNTQPQVPVYEFAEFCKDSGCTHHVRMGTLMGGGWPGKPFFHDRPARFTKNLGYGGLVLTEEEARGAAANIYGFGADGVGIWNVCCHMGKRHKPDANWPDRETFRKEIYKWVNAVASPEKVWSKPRRYHFIPIYKRETLKMRNYAVNGIRVSPFGAPVQIVTFWPQGKGFRQIFHFLMADGKEGEKLKGKLRFRILNSTLDDEFLVDINGTKIESQKVNREFVPDAELPAVWYEVALEDCPPFAGKNELGMTMTRMAANRGKDSNVSGEPLEEDLPYMEELDITVSG